jgi:hypothetical protein
LKRLILVEEVEGVEGAKRVEDAFCKLKRLKLVEGVEEV